MATVQHRESITDSGICYRVSRSTTSKHRLVLVMGYAGSLRTWPLQFVEELAQRFEVLTYDNMGTGKTAPPAQMDGYSIAAMAATIHDIAYELRWPRFNLLGYSMGGCIAMQYALEHAGNVETLLLMSTTAGGANRVPAEASVRETLVSPGGNTLWDMYLATFSLMFSDEHLQAAMPVLKEIYEQSKDTLISGSTLSGHDRAMKAFDLTEQLKNLKLPVTIITGADDKVVPAQNSQFLADNIAKSRLVVIPDCGHAPHIQAEALVIDEIANLAGRSVART